MSIIWQKRKKKQKKSDKNALHKCVFVTKIGSYWVSHQLHTIHLLHTSKFKTEKPCTSVSLRTDSSDFIYFLTSQTKAWPAVRSSLFRGGEKRTPDPRLYKLRLSVPLGKIRNNIYDRRSFRSWCIKVTDEFNLDKDWSVPLMHHGPSDLRL